MIYLYTGTPGSGKSLHAARDISDYLRLKKLPVVANFPINPETKGYERFTYRDNLHMTPEFLIEYARDFWGSDRMREDWILLVLDESQLLFNSRNWAAKDRMAWLEFFSQHRHLGYKIIMIVQSDRMIDRQIRSLAEYEFVHRKMGNMGVKGKLIKMFALGELYLCVERYYGLNEKIGVGVMRARKSLFALYDSYALFARTDADVEGAGSGDPPPILDVRPDEQGEVGRMPEMPPDRPSMLSRLRGLLNREIGPSKPKKGAHAKS